MSLYMLVAVTAAYLVTAMDQYLDNRPGLALVFLAYALANVGMIWEVLRPTSAP